LYDYVDERGRNSIRDWTEEYGRRQRAQLNSKLDQLAANGEDVGSNVLLRMSSTILKLKVRTKGVELRPMLCKGPLAVNDEFTILIGAREEEWALVPKDVVEQAEARRGEVLAAPQARRTVHERII
jgi:hypothetical protein